MSKKEKKLKEVKQVTFIDALVVLTTLLAAIVIIYTAYWYVKINKPQEIVVSEQEMMYVHDAYVEGEIVHSVSKMIDITNANVNIEDLESVYHFTEPRKIVRRKVITRDGKCKTYMMYHYSTELRAKTAYTYYKEDFDNVRVSIEDNVITLVCK